MRYPLPATHLQVSTQIWTHGYRWYCESQCHDCDCTYPCSPYPDLPMSFPSHQNHSRAPNATPKPFGSILSQLASQQRTPKHSDSLVSSRHIPNLMLLQPFLFLTSSRFLTSTLIPDSMPFDLHSSASSEMNCERQRPNSGSPPLSVLSYRWSWSLTVP